MEPRKPGKAKSMLLPLDYLKMVNEVFYNHFQNPLEFLSSKKKPCRFVVTGGIYPEEILLSVSLIQDGLLSATAVHASIDFDPTAKKPTTQDLLSACVDAVASLWAELLPPQKLEEALELIEKPLSAFENVPFVWSPMTIEKLKIFLCVDKTNPQLEEMTEDWLDKNDPKRQQSQATQSQEGEDLLAERVESKTLRGKKPNPTKH